jgi:hypothetical protein
MISSTAASVASLQPRQDYAFWAPGIWSGWTATSIAHRLQLSTDADLPSPSSFKQVWRATQASSNRQCYVYAAVLKKRTALSD